MSVSQIGIIKTDYKDVFKVTQILVNYIDRLVLESRNGFRDQSNKLSVVTLNPANKFCTIDFTLDGESRTLFVFFSGDHDYKDFYDGHKIILNLSDCGEGKAENIISQLTKALAKELNVGFQTLLN